MNLIKDLIAMVFGLPDDEQVTDKDAYICLVIFAGVITIVGLVVWEVN